VMFSIFFFKLKKKELKFLIICPVLVINTIIFFIIKLLKPKSKVLNKKNIFSDTKFKKNKPFKDFKKPNSLIIKKFFFFWIKDTPTPPPIKKKITSFLLKSLLKLKKIKFFNLLKKEPIKIVESKRKTVENKIFKLKKLKQVFSQTKLLLFNKRRKP